MYQPIILRFNTGLINPGTGGTFTETDASPHNPWVDYRCEAVFTSPTGETFKVPGFYAGNGYRIGVGSTWRVHFSPRTSPGSWTYTVQIQHEPGINLQDSNYVSSAPVLFAQSGGFPVANALSTAPGFYSLGFLTAVPGSNYLRHDFGRSFLMTGCGGPENFLAYDGFTGVSASQPFLFGAGCADIPTNPAPNGSWTVNGNRIVHKYEAHNSDFATGSDPTWGGTDGDNIIGAINYLSGVGFNSLYFLTMNLGGDGRDVHPFSDPGTNACTPTPASTVFNYSVARMHEWNIVFQHAQTKGILLNMVLAEREQPNIDWLGGSSVVGGVALSDERKLYLKNMVAMFAHNPGIKWNLCEENRDENNSEPGQFSSTELEQLGNWIADWDIYDHPKSVHTDPNDIGVYENLLAGNQADWLTNTSLQVHGESNSNLDSSFYGEYVRRAHDEFAQNGRSVVVDMDENGSPGKGAGPDTDTGDSSPEDRRKRILWDVYFGGANLSWYYGNITASNGGGDHAIEDFSLRQNLFGFTDIAASFLRRFDFSNFEPADAIVSTGCSLNLVYESGACDGLYGIPRAIAKVDNFAFVYYANIAPGGTFQPGTIDLTTVNTVPSVSTYTAFWINARTGDTTGPVVSGVPANGGHVPLPPVGGAIDGEDWVYYMQVE